MIHIFFVMTNCMDSFEPLILSPLCLFVVKMKTYYVAASCKIMTTHSGKSEPLILAQSEPLALCRLVY